MNIILYLPNEIANFSVEKKRICVEKKGGRVGEWGLGFL
jgi:hypothetical protein